MVKIKIPKNLAIIIVGILFLMSMMPGEGSKAANQQAIVLTDYVCSKDTDCPKCVGGGIIDYNESDTDFFGELSASICDTGVCKKSDACIVWDCGETQPAGTCSSVKQTILDNTIQKFNDNPIMIFVLIGFVVAFFML